MTLPIISIHRHVNGYQVREDFKFSSGAAAFVPVCRMCGASRNDTLTPVEMVDDCEENASISGAALCEGCCLSPDIGDGWPGLTLTEMRDLWALVRKEQVREATRELDRERAVSLTAQKIQRAIAAAKQARLYQSIDCVAEVVSHAR